MRLPFWASVLFVALGCDAVPQGEIRAQSFPEGGDSAWVFPRADFREINHERVCAEAVAPDDCVATLAEFLSEVEADVASQSYGWICCAPGVGCVAQVESCHPGEASPDTSGPLGSI